MNKPKKRLVHILNHSTPNADFSKKDYKIDIDDWHTIVCNELKKELDDNCQLECWRPEATISKEININVGGIKYRIFPSIKIRNGLEISFPLLWAIFKTTFLYKTIVEIHGIHYFTSNLIIILSSKYGKVIAQHHGDTFRYNKQLSFFKKFIKKVLYIIDRQALINCDIIFFLNKFEKAYLVHANKNSKAFFSTMGVKDNLFKPSNMIENRNKLNLDKESKIILFTARYSLAKGIVELITSISTLKNEIPNLKLIILGEGYESAEKIKLLIDKLKINENIIFGGQVSHELLPLYLNSSNLFCLPSYKEGFPVVCLEALSCNLKVISTTVGGLPDFKKTYGLIDLVKPKDIFALTSQIRMALNSNEELNSRRVIEKHFSWKSIVNRRKRLYRRLYDKHE